MSGVDSVAAEPVPSPSPEERSVAEVAAMPPSTAASLMKVAPALGGLPRRLRRSLVLAMREVLRLFVMAITDRIICSYNVVVAMPAYCGGDNEVQLSN